MGDIILTKGKREDLKEIQAIYNSAVLHTTATFDWNVRDDAGMIEWFKKFEEKFPLLVAKADNHVIGYCTLAPFREKDGYRYTEEVSIYVDESHRKKGIATKLLKEIIEIAKERKVLSIIACISEGNEGSVLLHKKFGFVHVGTFPKIGFKFDTFHDALFYQKEISENLI